MSTLTQPGKKSIQLDAALKISAVKEYLGIKAETPVASVHHSQSSSMCERIKRLQELADEAKRNDPEEQLKKLVKPPMSTFKYVNIMSWLQGCYDAAAMDVGTVFKIIYIPKNYSNKIRMEKYDYNGKEKFEKTNTVSSIEQFGHALKSRQDKINFFRNDQSTLAKYCLCIYDSKR